MPTYDKEELRVGLRDLLEKKKELLLRTRNAALYLDELARGLARLDEDAAGGVGASGKPAAAPAADHRHDALARFLRQNIASYLLDPDLDAASVERVERLLDFVPSAGDTLQDYSAEVAAARARGARLPEYAADLRLIPLAGGGTALEAFHRYLDAAEALDRAASEDAAASAATPNRSDIRKLHISLNGKLSKLRKAVEEEVAQDQSLPRTLAEEAFSYFTELDRRHKQRGKKKTSEPEAPPAPAP